jgi:MFS family permease
VTQGLSWHWIFWVNVPIGAVAAALSRARLEESWGPAKRLDWQGAALVACAAGAIVWGLVRSNDAGWSSVEVVVALVGGAALTAGFLAWEGRAREPMVPLGLFRVWAFAAANATAVLMMASVFSAAFLMSQYFQLSLGYGPLATGLRFLPWTATPLVVAPIAGAISDRTGPRPLMALGLLLQAGGLAWVAIVGTATAGYNQLVVPLVIAGVGISMAMPTTPVAAMNAVPAPEMGTASGVVNSTQRMGGVFGVAIVSSVFVANGHFGSPATVAAGFRPALAVSAALSLLGSLTALLARVRRQAAAPVTGKGAKPELVLIPVASAGRSAAAASGVIGG